MSISINLILGHPTFNLKYLILNYRLEAILWCLNNQIAKKMIVGCK